MSERRLLVPRLRALDHDLAARGVPPWVERRIAAALAEEATRRERGWRRFRWAPALAFVAGAALVSIAVGRAGGSATPPPRVVAGFHVEGDDCRATDDPEGLRVSGECGVERPGFRLRTWGDSQLATSDDGLQLARGRVLFQVDHVAPGRPPVRVHVSHGVIEVLGTRFVVDQQPGQGDVELLEGRIRFVGLDGTAHELAPGDRHAWGSPTPNAEPLSKPEPEPEPLPEPEEDALVITDDPPAPEPKRPPLARTTPPRRAPAPPDPDAVSTPPQAPAADLDPAAVIAHVAELRRLGHWRTAASELKEALRKPFDRRSLEVLSFELGDIVGRHLHDQPAACLHFRAHAERFPQGRYAAAVKRALAKCDGQ
jgi:hypothetical protein